MHCLQHGSIVELFSKWATNGSNVHSVFYNIGIKHLSSYVSRKHVLQFEIAECLLVLCITSVLHTHAIV